MKRPGDSAERPAHEDQGADVVGVLPVVFEGDLNAHRVRCDDRTLDAEFIADLSEVAGEVFDRQLVAVDWRPTAPVPSKMPVNHSVVPGETGREIPPGKAVTADSVS